MKNQSNWLSKVCGTKASLKEYKQRITQFGIFADTNFQIDIETLKEDFREAKYSGLEAQERFLDKLTDLLDEYQNALKRRGYTTNYISSCLSVVASYLHKGCKIKDVEVELPKNCFVKYHNRDLKKEEIQKILRHAKIRYATFYLMMCESGLRPNTVTRLRYRNIKEDFEKKIVPMKIDLPSKLLKDRISARWTFLGEDGEKLLREWLSLRDELKDNDLLFPAVRPHQLRPSDKEEPDTVHGSTFSNAFRKLVLHLGITETIEKGKPRPVRLYNLRKYFFNNMQCDSKYREFWGCHVQVSDHYISRDIERHRQEYKKGYKSLRIYAQPVSEDLLEENIMLRKRMNSLEKVIEVSGLDGWSKEEFEKLKRLMSALKNEH